MGNGSIANPWDLDTALASEVIRPGDTVLLQPGTYGDFVTTQKGTLAKPIIYQANGHVIIDGIVNLGGAEHVYLIDVDIDDTVSYAGGRPGDLSSGTPGYQPGEGCKLINSRVKNHQQGGSGGGAFSAWELYGCLFSLNGTDSQLGHGAYMQHDNVNGIARIKHNLFVDNLGYGLHIYGSSPLKNLAVLENIAVASGSIRSDPKANILVGGTGGIHFNTVDGNICYHYDNQIAMQVGYGPNTWEDIQVINNLLSSPTTALTLTAVDLNNCDCDENLFYGNPSGFTSVNYPNNTYSSQASQSDSHVLHSNEYDANRAHLAIFNSQAQANTVDIDVSSIFGHTGTVRAHNVQDYWSDIQILTITAGIITINMEAANRSVETPVGWAAPPTIFPDFGCFILILQ